MATVNLMYFGSVTDVTGISAEKADSPATLDELNEMLQVKYPKLSGISYRYSVNRQLVTGNRQLVDGDDIALLPPFAGG